MCKGGDHHSSGGDETDAASYSTGLMVSNDLLAGGLSSPASVELTLEAVESMLELEPCIDNNDNKEVFDQGISIGRRAKDALLGATRNLLPTIYERLPMKDDMSDPGSDCSSADCSSEDETIELVVRCEDTEDGIRSNPIDFDGSMNKSPTSAIATWYMDQLNTHELRTKFVTSAIMGLVGDIIAQSVGIYMTKGTTLDKRRMLAMFMDGLMCTGPLLHYIYEMYEYILPTHESDARDNLTQDDPSETKRSRFLAVLGHVLVDNFVMVIVYIGALMIFTGLIEGRQDFIIHELKNDLIPDVIVSWKVSILGYVPMQLLSFHFLPMKLRVLAVNILDVVWVTVMSYVTHRNRH